MSSKTVPNIHENVPMVDPQCIMRQTSEPFYQPGYDAMVYNFLQNLSTLLAYEVENTANSSSVSSASNLAPVSSSSDSGPNSSNMSYALGLTSTSLSTTTTSELKNSLSDMSKTVSHIPQNMAVDGHQNIIGQTSEPFHVMSTHSDLQCPLLDTVSAKVVTSNAVQHQTLAISQRIHPYEDWPKEDCVEPENELVPAMNCLGLYRPSMFAKKEVQHESTKDDKNAVQTTSHLSTSGSSSSSRLKFEDEFDFDSIFLETTGVEFDRIFSATNSTNRTIHCKGLAPTTTNELIKQVFSPFGIIENIKLCLHLGDYGFIRFNTKEAACLAICSMDGAPINGCPVRCSWAFTSRRNSYTDLRRLSESSSGAGQWVSISEGSSIWQSRLTPESSSASNVLHDTQDRFSTEFGSSITGAASVLLEEDEPRGAASSRLLCKICMDDELGVVFQPCGHLASCVRCARQIHSCPVCRIKVTKTVRTYLS